MTHKLRPWIKGSVVEYANGLHATVELKDHDFAILRLTPESYVIAQGEPDDFTFPFDGDPDEEFATFDGAFARLKEVVAMADELCERHAYRAVWEIDVEAQSPEHAARAARHHQVKPGTTATVFDIHREGYDPVRVDLTEIAEAGGEAVEQDPLEVAKMLLDEALGALAVMSEQIGQMKGMFNDEDEQIAKAEEDGDDAFNRINAFLKGKPLPDHIWADEDEGDDDE